MNFMILMTLLMLMMMRVDASREVTLSCGADDVMERGLPGAPGKKGPMGSTGVKGEPGVKGTRGQTGESRDAIARLEERINELENGLQPAIVRTIRDFNRRNCADVASEGVTESGIYSINIGGTITEIYCDMNTDGGNWTTFQRRRDGSEDFYRTYDFYVQGFGDKTNEFWLGLENLHLMTTAGSYELRVDLEDFEDNHAYAKYSSFSVGPSSDNYRLSVSGYDSSSTAGDSLAVHNNQQFSTKDQDHDTDSGNCAVTYHGAWWYINCHHSNLNGEYISGGQSNNRGINWQHWKNNVYSMKRSEMKIRPRH